MSKIKKKLVEEEQMTFETRINQFKFYKIYDIIENSFNMINELTIGTEIDDWLLNLQKILEEYITKLVRTLQDLESK